MKRQIIFILNSMILSFIISIIINESVGAYPLSETSGDGKNTIERPILYLDMDGKELVISGIKSDGKSLGIIVKKNSKEKWRSFQIISPEINYEDIAPYYVIGLKVITWAQ